MKNLVRGWLFFAAALTTHSSIAATVTIGGNQDTTIFSNGATQGLGGGVGMFAGTDANGASGVKRALLSFDIAQRVPAGSQIQSVALTLTLGQVAGAGSTFNGGDATSREIDLHRVTASWGEGTAGQGSPITLDGQGFAAADGDATWSARAYSAATPTSWDTAGGDFSSTASGSQLVGNPHNNTTQFTWSGSGMVADVQAWLDSGDADNFGWILINTDETDAKTFRAFFSREQGGAAAPTLTITYVPEPGTLAISLPGALGLAMLAWRRKRRRPPASSAAWSLKGRE